MLIKACLALAIACTVNGQFYNGFQNNMFANRAMQRFGNSGGNSAAAGKAVGAGEGSSSSINQANHQADRFNTMSNALSANTATGTMGSQANGAAQAGGQVNYGMNSMRNFGQQPGIFGARRKRQVSDDEDDDDFGDDNTNTGVTFAPFPSVDQSLQSAKAMVSGGIANANRVLTQIGPNSALSFASASNVPQSSQLQGVFNTRQKRLSGSDDDDDDFGDSPSTGTNSGSGFTPFPSVGQSIQNAQAMANGGIGGANRIFTQIGPHHALSFAAASNVPQSGAPLRQTGTGQNSANVRQTGR